MMAIIRVATIVAVLATVACGSPGPLPPVPSSPDPRDSNYFRDRFPTDSDIPFPLDDAIRENRLDDMQRLLQQGANPNLRWGQSGDHFPLQEVLDTGGGYSLSDSVAAVRMLLEHGADPNAKWCPFESRGGSESFPSCRSAHAATPLMFAARAGSIEIVDLLLRAGADPSPRDWFNGSALDYAYDEIVFELISRALFPDLRTRDREALSWLKPFEGYYRRTPWDSTPLSRAIALDGGLFFPPPSTWSRAGSEPQLGRVRTLLRIGVDPNERATPTGGDWTPLGIALEEGAIRTARVLLQSGADPDQRWCVEYSFNSYRWPPRASNPDRQACRSADGMTPLMWSASKGAREAVALLLEFNADRALTDWAGRTAMDHAATADIRRLLATSG